MNYIDMVKLYSKIIALYCRVSTAGQDISKQITLAEVYLTQNKIPVDSVIQFIDHNVSANKRTFLNRPELQKLLKQIKAQYKVKIKNFSCHSFRKTFGRQVYNMNSDNSEFALVKLMELFNHSSIMTTKRYLAIRQQELLETYDCLSF